jgi:opacity protein-like surface antigen
MKKNLFLLLALGTYTAAHACPCGCVKVCVDNLADRSAAREGAYSVDFRYDTIDQDERNSGAHAHFLAYHRILTGTIETQLAGQTWSIAVPRLNRIVRSNIAPTVLNPNPINTRQEVVGLGDISVTTRFAWSDYTIIAGVKLPTGTDDLTLNVSRRYLQPGTGTTDLILGLRRDYAATSDRPQCFWQLGAQGAVFSDANFRPGTTLSATAGVRYELASTLAFSLQATALRQFRDKNTMAAAGNVAYAEDLETAAFSTHLAAGLTYKLTTNTRAYVYYSCSLKNNNLADKPNGTEVNVVHSTDVWSVGLSYTF